MPRGVGRCRTASFRNAARANGRLRCTAQTRHPRGRGCHPVPCPQACAVHGLGPQKTTPTSIPVLSLAQAAAKTTPDRAAEIWGRLATRHASCPRLFAIWTTPPRVDGPPALPNHRPLKPASPPRRRPSRPQPWRVARRRPPPCSRPFATHRVPPPVRQAKVPWGNTCLPKWVDRRARPHNSRASLLFGS